MADLVNSLTIPNSEELNLVETGRPNIRSIGAVHAVERSDCSC